MIGADEIRAIRDSCDEDFVTVCDAALAGDPVALEQVAWVRDFRQCPPCPPRLPNLLIFVGAGGYGEYPTERPIQAMQRASSADHACFERVVPLTDAIWATGEYNSRRGAWTWRY